MAKKKGRYEPIDEDMIRNLIGGVDAPPRLVPKQVPTAPPTGNSPTGNSDGIPNHTVR